MKPAGKALRLSARRSRGALVRGAAIALAFLPTLGLTAPDAQALLDRNGCLGCHGTSYKIVGPAYRDVAKRYRSDADPVSRLSQSIREGSVGRWGPVPMPGFKSLSDAELRALARFVLSQ